MIVILLFTFIKNTRKAMKNSNTAILKKKKYNKEENISKLYKSTQKKYHLKATDLFCLRAFYNRIKKTEDPLEAILKNKEANPEKKIEEKKENKRKEDKNIVANTLCNIFPSLSLEEAQEKRKEIKAFFLKRKIEVFLLFSEFNLEKREGKIRGLFYLLDKITPGLWEVTNKSTKELYLIDPKWLKKIR
jgi:hypothetical protein